MVKVEIIATENCAYRYNYWLNHDAFFVFARHIYVARFAAVRLFPILKKMTRPLLCIQQAGGTICVL